MPRKPSSGYRKTYLREWRDFRGLTGEQLAELAGTTAATVSRISSGEGYTADMLHALAGALKCEPADILGHDPNSPRYQLWRMLDHMTPDQIGKALNVIRAALGDVLPPDADLKATGRSRPFGKRRLSRSR